MSSKYRSKCRVNAEHIRRRPVLTFHGEIDILLLIYMKEVGYMDLTMWVLYDALRAFDIHAEPAGGDAPIEGARIFSDGGGADHRLAYVASAEDYIGAYGSLLVNRRDVLLVRGVSSGELINKVLEIFDSFRDWGNRLAAASADTGNYQALLDIAHEKLPYPMFFGKKDMRIHAITYQYDSADVFEMWDAIKEIGTIPPIMFEKMRPYNLPGRYPDDVDPIAIPAEVMGAVRYTYALRKNCYVGDTLWGDIWVYYKETKLSPAIFQIMGHIAACFSELVDKSVRAGSNRQMQFLQLVDAIDGKRIPDDERNRIYGAAYWNVADRLVLYKVDTAQTEYDHMLHGSVYEHLFSAFPLEIVFSYAKSVVIITCEEKQIEAEIAAGLNRAFRGNVRLGVSLPFIGIENISEYYEQASIAIERSNDKSADISAHRFADDSLGNLAAAFRRRFNCENWIVPELLALITADREHGTQYFKTLFCLLRNYGHRGRTSEELFVHRNTLSYRLERIFKLLGADISDERFFSYLRFCCELIATGSDISESG
jgi:hypothetical protein